MTGKNTIVQHKNTDCKFVTCFRDVAGYTIVIRRAKT